jgi:hypothetical protein
MEEIARLHGAASIREGHSFRNGEHRVDEVPRNGVEIFNERATVALGIEACGSAQHGLDDDFEGGASYRSGRIHRAVQFDGAPALDLRSANTGMGESIVSCRTIDAAARPWRIRDLLAEGTLHRF